MAQFTFTVTDPEGRRSEGSLMATDMPSAIKILAEKDLVVTRIEPATKGGRGLWRSFGARVGLRPALKGDGLVAFTQQLAAMLESGLTVRQAIDAIMTDNENAEYRSFLVQFSAGLGEGRLFTELLADFPDTFSPQYVAMAASGEASGRLAETLQSLADLLEKSEAMKRKVRSAFYYPLFVLGAAGTILVLMLIFVTPRYVEFYASMGGSLPAPTKMLLAAGQFFRTKLWLLALLAVACALAADRFIRSPKGRLAVDRLVLKLPLVGDLMRMVGITRFCRSFSCLQQSGLPVVQALQLVAETTGNAQMEKALYWSASDVLEGKSLTDALRKSGVFTDLSLNMMGVGEQSGRLDAMMGKVANYYESRVDAAVRGIASLVEPVVIIGVGIVVGIMVICMVLPVFNMATTLFDK